MASKGAIWVTIGLATLGLVLLFGGFMAWTGLGLPFAKLDPVKLPGFFWYYRHDRRVIKWLAIGMAIAAVVVIGGVVAFLRRPRALHGDARFARETEIRREGMRDSDGIVLGRKQGRFLIFGGNEHVLLEAPTRSGKGVGIVIPNLLTWAGSVVVLDIKRENWDATAGFRQAHGQKVFLFNPMARDRATARYNPLGHINRRAHDDVVTELQKIATMLFPVPDRADPFWTQGAITGFVGVGALVAAMDAVPFTLGEIYRQVTQPGTQEYLRKQVAELERHMAPGGVRAIHDFIGGAENTVSGLKQTITSRLNLWLDSHVDAATSASDFDLRAIRDERISIYLGVSPDELERVAPLYNLFFQQLIDLNTRDLPDAGRHGIGVLVLLDEFARLGRANVIANGFSFVAGYGFRLLPVIQSRSQLRAVYGNDVADEIVANCGVEVAFTPKELKVANELSERIGFVGQTATTKSRTIHGMLANRSMSESDQRRALMLPQELMQLPRDRMLILRGGMPPVMATKIRYFTSRLFTRRILPAPVVAAAPAIARPAAAMPVVEAGEDALSLRAPPALADIAPPRTSLFGDLSKEALDTGLDRLDTAVIASIGIERFPSIFARRTATDDGPAILDGASETVEPIERAARPRERARS